MAYADYAFYTGTYLGTAIAEADFPQLALRASAVIDAATFGRAAKLETTDEIYEQVKMATCAIADELQRQDKNPVDGITSESQGRYSVSYAANSSKTKSNQAKLFDVAKLYLANTGLMYTGIP